MIKRTSIRTKSGSYLGYGWVLEIEHEEDNIIEWLSIFRNGVRCLVPKEHNKKKFSIDLIHKIIEDINARD